MNHPEEKDLNVLIEGAEHRINESKIVVVMRPVGNHQIGSGGIEAKEMKIKVSLNKPVVAIIQHIRKFLKLPTSESLYVYVNDAFIPSPNDYLFDLFKNHGVENKLIFAYSTAPVWG